MSESKVVVNNTPFVGGRKKEKLPRQKVTIKLIEKYADSLRAITYAKHHIPIYTYHIVPPWTTFYKLHSTITQKKGSAHKHNNTVHKGCKKILNIINEIISGIYALFS